MMQKNTRSKLVSAKAMLLLLAAMVASPTGSGEIDGALGGATIREATLESIKVEDVSGIDVPVKLCLVEKRASIAGVGIADRCDVTEVACNVLEYVADLSQYNEVRVYVGADVEDSASWGCSSPEPLEGRITVQTDLDTSSCTFAASTGGLVTYRVGTGAYSIGGCAWDVAPPAPDLCDDKGDKWEKVAEANPNKDAALLIGAGTSQDDAGTLLEGEVTYQAEVWKCEDFNRVNEVRYVGKSGYSGGGLGWSYEDPFYLEGVVVYQSVRAMDVGQPIAEHWVEVPPTYTSSATLTLASVGVEGHATWDTLFAPSTGGAIWVGDFEEAGEGGALITAKILGYL